MTMIRILNFIEVTERQNQRERERERERESNSLKELLYKIRSRSIKACFFI